MTVDATAAAPTDTETATPDGEPTPTNRQDDVPAGSEQVPEESRADAAKPQRGKPKSSARKTRTVVLTLTVTGTADGEWQAELKHGSKWVARGLDIPAAAVSRAAKELHEELSVPIDEVINAAREQQQAKVAQLEAELEQAKQALAELEA